MSPSEVVLWHKRGCFNRQQRVQYMEQRLREYNGYNHPDAKYIGVQLAKI